MKQENSFHKLVGQDRKIDLVAVERTLNFLLAESADFVKQKETAVLLTGKGRLLAYSSCRSSAFDRLRTEESCVAAKQHQT